jgi:probable F420-dependent oxidoreductase
MTRRPGIGQSIIPKASLFLSNLHRVLGRDIANYVRVAEAADRTGFAQVIVPDHVVMGSAIDRYPYGRTRFLVDDPWPEPLTLLTAIAARTTRIRVGTGVLLAPLRPPPFLAKQVATLDVLSQGRVDLGVGVGWQREEYEACGIEFQNRWTILDKVARACRRLWEGSDGTSWCYPTPVQKRVPIWLGAKPTQRLADRIMEYGDGWMPLTSAPPGEVVDGCRTLRSAFAAAGRDPSTLLVRCGWPGDPGAASQLRDAGVTHFSFRLPDEPMSMNEVEGFLAASFEAVLAWGAR